MITRQLVLSYTVNVGLWLTSKFGHQAIAVTIAQSKERRIWQLYVDCIWNYAFKTMPFRISIIWKFRLAACGVTLRRTYCSEHGSCKKKRRVVRQLVYTIFLNGKINEWW